MKGGFLGLEIANSRIRYSYVAKHKRGYTILRSGAVNYTLDVAAAGELTRVVLGILSQEGIRPSRITVSLSLKEIFLKAMVVPDLSTKELEEAIPNEIEKVARFANKDFRIIYHKFDDQKGGKRAVFGAVYQDVLDYIFTEIAALKISFRHIEVVPLNLKEILDINDRSAGAQAILIFNDRISYFLIYRGRDISLIYQTPFGTDHLFPQGKGTMIDDRVFKNAVGELHRVLKSYLAENKETSIDKLWLLWDKEVSPGFASYVQEHLGLSVREPAMEQFVLMEAGHEHLLNPLNLLAAVPALHSSRKTKTLFAFDRFFQAVHMRQYAVKVSMYALVLTFMISALCAFLVFGFHQQQTAALEERTQIEMEIEKTRVEAQPLFDKRTQYETMRQGLFDQATYVKVLNRISWSEVLEIVAKKMPEELSLTAFSFEENGEATFTGDAYNVETIAEVIRKVDDSLILENAAFDYLSEKTIEEKKIFQFGIKAQLVAPKWDDYL